MAESPAQFPGVRSYRQEDAWTGDYAWFYATNYTTNQTSGWVYDYENGAHNIFAGQSAEAVVERPAVNGGYPNLANYGTVAIQGFYVDDYRYGWGNQPFYVLRDMWSTGYTSGDLLSYASADTAGSTSYFTFYASH